MFCIKTLLLSDGIQLPLQAYVKKSEAITLKPVMVSSIKRLKHILSLTPQNKNAQSTQPVTQPMTQLDHK